MRFDLILPRLTDEDFDFETVLVQEVSRKAGEEEKVVEVPQRVLDDYTKIIWKGRSPMPSLAECEAEWQKILAENRMNEILEKRREAYPSIADQLDMIYWDRVNGTNNWEDAIQAVKDAYPKE